MFKCVPIVKGLVGGHKLFLLKIRNKKGFSFKGLYSKNLHIDLKTHISSFTFIIIKLKMILFRNLVTSSRHKTVS